MRALFLLSLCIALKGSFFLAGSNSFEHDPHALVANHVDSLSGAWIEEERDLFVSSREPFFLCRYYSSEWGKWKFFPHCCLVQSKTPSEISTFEKNGTKLYFVQHDKQKHFQSQLVDDGYCNTAHGPISRSTNYSNFLCRVEEAQIILTLADGTKRTYEMCDSSDLGPLCAQFSELPSGICYRLRSEVFLSQASITYSYDDLGRLSILECIHDPKKPGRVICFRYEENDVHVALDGKNVVTYHHCNGQLIHVSRLQKPAVSYTYQGKLLTKKVFPQGRYEEIVYDECGRVKALFKPNLQEPLYAFEYRQGVTEATHARGHKLLFHYENELLQAVSLFDENGLYRTDRFIWSDDPCVKRLLGHTTHAKDGACLWATTNEYTQDGNLTKSKEFSVETEHPETAIRLNNRGLAVGEPESETPTFSYKGPFGALSEQRDETGNRVRYKYKEGTSLLLQKFEENKNHIISREFYHYDEKNSALIGIVRDNGASAESDADLYWVSERAITEIKPRSYPKEGLDEEIIVQKFYDSASKTEKLALRVHLFYDTDNNLVRKELYDTQNVLAKTEEYAYDSHGNCIRAVDALGQLVLKAYDENDNCIRIEECPAGRITLHEYDVNNLRISTTVTYLDGSKVTTSSMYDGFGNKVCSFDRYGNGTEYEYDLFSRVVSVTHPEVFDEQGNPIRPKETLAYDIFNNVTEKTDPRGYKEKKRVTSTGKSISITYPDGSEERFDYIGDRIQSIKNRDASITRYQYNSDKCLRAIETFSETHCIMQQEFAYKLRSNRFKQAQRPNGSVVFRTYDCYGRVLSEIETTEPSRKANLQYQSIKTDYEYDTLHRPHRIKRWIYESDFIVECLRYDLLDRVSERWIEEPDGSKTSHQVFLYDGFGNITERLSNGSVEKIEYLEEARPHCITAFDGSMTRIEYNEAQYNSLGQRYLEKVIIDPSGMRNCLSYDALGRQVQFVAKAPLGEVIASRQQFFDASNNLCVCLEAKDSSQTIRTEWVYGPLQRLQILREAVGTDVFRETRYTYDASGRIVYVAQSDGSGCSYEYGVDGSLAKMYNAKHEVMSQLYFNSFGQCVGGESADKVKTGRTYSTQGLITEEMVTDGRGSYTTSFTYDGLGRLRYATLPDKTTIRYEYCGTKPKAVRLGYLPDFKHEFTKWDETGTPVEERLFTGDLKTTSYSAGHALSSVSTPYFSQAILKRDGRGNPVVVEQEKKTLEYHYNALNQLVEEKTEKKKQCFSYDSLGSIVRHNDSQFHSNALNQVTDNDLPYRYDSRGNLVSDGTFSFTYNDCNQLIKAQNIASGKSVTYAWDVFGRRISRKSENSVHRFMYIGNTEMGSLDASGYVQDLKVPERVVGNEAYGAVLIQLNWQKFVPISDLFGNIVQLIDRQSKETKMTYEYDAYGHEEIHSHYAEERFRLGEDNPYRYRGMRTDPLTKHVLFTFRDYSPKLLQFITQDPTGYADGPNLYGYARGNPISNVDLYGLETKNGACLCHGRDCDYYKNGVCGHYAGIIIEEDRPNHRGQVVKEFYNYEQTIERDRVNRECSWPVNYSRSFEIDGEVVPGKGFGFINGVGNTFTDAQATALYMSGLAGGKNVQLTYAASNGLLRDLRQAALNLYGHYATNATKLLLDTWNAYFDTYGPDARFLQVCHSWGAIHVRNALMLFDPERRKQIDVLAIAPGAYIDKDLCRDVMHIINEDATRDFIPRIDQVGFKMALEQGKVLKIRAHAEANDFDHAVLSPTYKEPLNLRIRKYFNK